MVPWVEHTPLKLVGGVPGQVIPTPVATGGLQIDSWSTINRWSFYQISECQATLNKRIMPTENLLATVLVIPKHCKTVLAACSASCLALWLGARKRFTHGVTTDSPPTQHLKRK